MFKKFLFYVLFPGVILGVVYSSGVNNGKRSVQEPVFVNPASSTKRSTISQPIKKSVTTPQTEQEFVEKFLEKHNAQLASKGPTMAKPRLAPSEPTERPMPSRFVTVDEFGAKVLADRSAAEKPLLPLKPMKQVTNGDSIPETSGIVHNPASPVDCDCGVEH